MPRGSCGACIPLAVRPPLLRQALFPLASSVAGKPDDPGHNGPNALLSGKGMPSLPFHDARPQILDHSTGGYLLDAVSEPSAVIVRIDSRDTLRVTTNYRCSGN